MVRRDEPADRSGRAGRRGDDREPGLCDQAEDRGDQLGLEDLLRDRGDRFVGIINGIDTEVWDPETDRHLPVTYGMSSIARKREVASNLRRELGFAESQGPLLGMVTRLTDQKGVDLALNAVARIPDPDVAFVLLGSGDPALAVSARALANDRGGRFVFIEDFDEGLAHRISPGSDLIVSPVAVRTMRADPDASDALRGPPGSTPVGGLRDTVIDADGHPEEGNGFVAAEVSAEALLMRSPEDSGLAIDTATRTGQKTCDARRLVVASVGGEVRRDHRAIRRAR